jgi:UDP-N-acetylglucosamine--N-acetylmuramyl-(pentapeptide) pyrophosphoryl-undecaprenol N-acetylglucosamine transferase
MATTSERALDHLPREKTSVVGYPVRDGFAKIDRASARDRLGVPADEKLLLVAAGSLGARKINEAIVAALPRLLERCRILHITGAADLVWINERRAGQTSAQQARYAVHAYTDDMPLAMIAADLVVGRAGASTLGELPAAGAASILVPGEYEGWSQAPNAEFLQEQGAAVMLRNADLDRLPGAIIELLADEARLARMRDAARALARPDAARELARMLVEAAA